MVTRRRRGEVVGESIGRISGSSGCVSAALELDDEETGEPGAINPDVEDAAEIEELMAGEEVDPFELEGFVGSVEPTSLDPGGGWVCCSLDIRQLLFDRSTPVSRFRTQNKKQTS